MDKSDWQGEQGAIWAQEWRRTDRSFLNLTERLLGSLRGKSFAALLDVGCGAGELSLAIARGHPRVRVVGLDVSPQLVAMATERGANLPDAGFVCADAAQWQPEAGFVPSQIISRHGVMFFAQPVVAFANLAALAAPEAELVFSCFRGPEENPFFHEVGRLLPAMPVPAAPLVAGPLCDLLAARGYAPGPFAFADPDLVAAILAEAGWSEIGFERVDFAMVVGAGPSPLDDAAEYLGRIGPAARIVASLAPAAREKFFAQLRQFAASCCEGGIVALPAAAWLVRARKAGEVPIGP